MLSTRSLVDHGHRTASCDTSLVVSGGVDCLRRLNVYDKKPQRYAKDNRTAHVTARSDKSVAYATYQRLVLWTRHSPSLLSVLHLPLEQFTACDEARYWLRIESRFLPSSPAFDAPIRGFSSEYCYDVWYGKTRMMWLPEVKNVEDMFSRFDRIQERDRRTHRHRMTA